MAGETPPFADRLGRPMRDLRISVMDHCNFRCPYCMPETTYHEQYRFLDPQERLSFDEIERVARVAAGLGVTKLRLTGGEPLLRPGLAGLVTRLTHLPGIEDIALTTNGVLLPRHAADLRAAGLSRVTISLDSLDPVRFARMSGGRAKLDQVLDGIASATAQDFPGGVKINTVLQRSVNEADALPLVRHFRHTGIVLRFIEYMDVGNRNGWALDDVVPSRELHDRIAAVWPLEPLSPRHRGEVARRYRFLDGAGEIGFVSAVTAPFCGDCSRARLSSDGRFYTCLFATTGTDLRAVLRADALPEVTENRLHALLSSVWRNRTDRYSEERASPPPHGHREKVEMHYIGG
ncbi:GTP 3',8-cyclase MoaA [Acidomonas methanolica]|uniref:GTP 3',8-cyclase MoaA n=1 Tax=Acidomonas methanolica TaxID=437 RepID=UPI00211A34DF|nr:GTP 3',8-cyclase MoaA [Acidomonas methanolica]MCQ9155711.1 GTP 3',8-cyclase MoaA [Acidomonas methanolica]